SLSGFVGEPGFIGFVLPGISRATAMSSVYRGMTTNATFPIEWLYGEEHLPDEVIDAPANVYLPYLNVLIEIPDVVTWGFWGGNETFRVPIPSDSTTVPLSSFILSLDISQAVDPATFLQIVYFFVEGEDIDAIFIPVLAPLLNRGITFPYVATAPAWHADD
ncbi:MAG: hypothetical protein KJ042_15460, partial [Deltaproteobacteria bacterium]|nr:hypothetical protein [Deltaproteobacteria bacterium]